MNDNLFDPSEIPEVSPLKPTKFCRTCKHRERGARGDSIIQYCGVRKSGRTFNGLMKIKVTNPACVAYKSESSN